MRFLPNRRKAQRSDTMYFLLSESVLMSHRTFSFSDRSEYRQLDLNESDGFENNSEPANLFDSLVRSDAQTVYIRSNRHKP